MGLSFLGIKKSLLGLDLVSEEAEEQVSLHLLYKNRECEVKNKEDRYRDAASTLHCNTGLFF